MRLKQTEIKIMKRFLALSIFSAILFVLPVFGIFIMALLNSFGSIV